MTSAGDRISWSNPRVLAVLLLVFLSGGLSGAITFRLARRASAPSRPSTTTTSSAPSWNNKDGFLGKCKKELNLTPDQAKKMSAVLDDYKMYYQNLQEQLDEVRATGKGRILEILDPEQKQKFEKLLGDSK
jgi:Spy/CpxP family protein refolding chaperone